MVTLQHLHTGVWHDILYTGVERLRRISSVMYKGLYNEVALTLSRLITLSLLKTPPYMQLYQGNIYYTYISILIFLKI